MSKEDQNSSEQTDDKSTDDIDQELADVQKRNEGFMDLDEPSSEEPEEPKEDPKEEPEEPEPQKEDPSSSTDDDPEEKEPEEKEPEEDPEPPKRKSRKELYIPVPKYTEEKRQWKEEKEQLESKLEELSEKIAEAGESTDETDNEIEQFAEEAGMDKEQFSKFIGLIEKRVASKTELPEEIRSVLLEKKEQQLEQTVIKQFNEEFNSEGEPTLKELYPDLSDEKLSEMKDFIDETAHSDKYVEYDLSDIIALKRKDLDEIAGQTKEATQKPDTSPEKSRLGGGAEKLSPKEFDKPDADFSQISNLPKSEREEFMSKLSPEAYVKYIDHISIEEDDLTVSRGGRTIRLKK